MLQTDAVQSPYSYSLSSRAMRKSPKPLRIRVLRRNFHQPQDGCDQDEVDVDRRASSWLRAGQTAGAATSTSSAGGGGGYYQVLHRLYSKSPLTDSNSIDNINHSHDCECDGEIETALEQYVVPETAPSASPSSSFNRTTCSNSGNRRPRPTDWSATDRDKNTDHSHHNQQQQQRDPLDHGRVLWRRVVVRSGPSTAGHTVIHASYQLPEECNNATYNSSLSRASSILCWTTFADRPHHLMLCALASPTLLCIWDVYPTQPTAAVPGNKTKQMDKQHLNQNRQQQPTTQPHGQALTGGESHMIPLPFEAEAIFAVRERGLLIQRAETTEDIGMWTATGQPLASPISTTPNAAVAASDHTTGRKQSHSDDSEYVDIDDDEHDIPGDGGFVLQDPPPPRFSSSRAAPQPQRESLGGSSFASSLNISTTTPAASVGFAAATSNIGGTAQSIPSIFSLSHPFDDVLPVSTFADEGWYQSLASDIFEKILFVGQATWMDDDTSDVPFIDRQVHTQKVCVKYHTQFKTHSIWEVKDSPPPPPQAPLWQVSSNWRSKTPWDSHLSALEQGFDDMDIEGRNRPQDPTPHFDTVNRKEALADALGVTRRTPRSSSSDNAGPSAATRQARYMPSARRNAANNSLNATMLSPISRPGSTRSEAGSHFFGDVDTPQKADQTMVNSIGPFSNLHPKLTLTCIYRETHPCPVSDNVFLVSDAKGSGLLSLCMVGGVPSENSGSPPSINKKGIKIIAFEIEDKSNQSSVTDELEKLRGKLRVDQIHAMPCIAAQPIESTPTPKNFQPHRSKMSSYWQRNATDILLLHQATNETSVGIYPLQLSLYRNTIHITDCAIVGHDLPDECIYLQHPVGCALDMFIMDASKQDKLASYIRGSISLAFLSCPVAERMLQGLEAEMIQNGLEELALKLRADCIRLAQSTSNGDIRLLGAHDEYTNIVIEVVLAVFYQALSINYQTEPGLTSGQQLSSWDKLIQSPYHQQYEETLKVLPACRPTMPPSKQSFFSSGFSRLNAVGSLALDKATSLTPETATLMFDTLHMLYEDFKLSTSDREKGLHVLGAILSSMCSVASKISTNGEDIALSYLSYYSGHQRELQGFESTPDGSNDGICVDGTEQWSLSRNPTPPSILSWLESTISGSTSSLYFSFVDPCKINAACTKTRSILRIFNPLLTKPGASMDHKAKEESDFAVAKLMLEEGLESHSHVQDDLPIGVSIHLVEILRRCKMNAHLNAAADAAFLTLVGREDMLHNTLQRNEGLINSCESDGASSDSIDRHQKEDNDGVSQMEVSSSMIFPEDNRVREVCRLLRTSRPVFLRVPRPVELSDHDYERKKQEKLLLLSRRTLALPIGRGMFTIGNLKPVPAEPLPLPELCLSGRVPPTNATLVLDTSECPADLKIWPEFHNGVACGLRLPLNGDANDAISKINRTWIVYNRPSNHDRQLEPTSNQSPECATKSLNHAHGGLLMALGMRGHLTALEMTDVFDYLTHGSVTTTVGVLLGMAANLRGTCDMSVSKMLCLHIPSLIPQHFSTIDVASTVQAAAVAGAGLLYEGSCHRMMTEFLLNEIGKRPSADGNVLDREAYSIACGISLGMVNLCKGGIDPVGTGTAGLADLKIEERLYRYIVGGTDDSETRRRREESDRLSLHSSSGSGNNEKCSCVYEGESINTDVTAPGSTLALGLIYLKSGNESIASAIALPDTHFLLEYVRPDFLMLRVISRALIMWDNVQPTDEWVEAQMPSAITKAYAEMAHLAKLIESGKATAEDYDKDYDRQAVRLIYVHVLAGACFALGLRFAGTGDPDAASVVMGRLQELCDLRNGHDAVNAALRPPTPVLEMCLGSVAISLSMVLAGTGDLDALRMLKIVRWPCTDEITYGSHLAYSMAIGLLFLGGAKSTLGREASDIAALLMSLYPRFPSSTSDNQYHLQALRNLYALAVRHREIKAVDIDTGTCIPVPVEIHFSNPKLQPICKRAPFLLMNTDDPISYIRVVSDRYYDLCVPLDDCLHKKTLFVKRKGRYQDKDDPSSSRVLFDGMGKVDGSQALDFLSRENKYVFAFGKHICSLGQPRSPYPGSSPFSLPGFCLRAMFQCLHHDSLEAIPIYLALRNSIDLVEADDRNHCRQSLEWDIRLLRSYYQRLCAEQKNDSRPQSLLSTEIVAYLMEALEQVLAARLSRNSNQAKGSSYFGVSNNIIDLGNAFENDMDLN